MEECCWTLVFHSGHSLLDRSTLNFPLHCRKLPGPSLGQVAQHLWIHGIQQRKRLRRSALAFIHLDGSRTGGGPIPNSFAYFALFAWPAVCVVLFVMLPVEAAAIWSLLGGYLLLPSATNFDAPLLPPLDKSTIPAITTILLCWMKGTQSPPPERSFLIFFLVILFIICPILTS